ncbi:MAG: amidase family protein, partial [Proteobacteria bacterium]|nr:amidase family protein [Pseudomonadota bacterium]
MLCNKSAVELATMLRTRVVSCVEVMDAHLAQIERYNPRLNAIVTLVADQARATAVQYDAHPPHVDAMPLLWGLPTAHKDLLNTRG